MLVNGAGSRHVRLRSFFFLLLLRERRSSSYDSNSFLPRGTVFNVVEGTRDRWHESVDFESEVEPRTQGGRAKKENKKKRRRRKSRNGRRSLDGIRYVSWNRPAAIRLGPSAEMLEDILYSKRVVTLVWFNSRNKLRGARSIFLPPREHIPSPPLLAPFRSANRTPQRYVGSRVITEMR